MGTSKLLVLLTATILIASTGLTSASAAQESSQVPVVKGEPIPPRATQSALPALVIRPSVHNANQLNDCVVEMHSSAHSKDQVILKITVPDSVDMIEVVPNQASGSSRNFRVRVDQNSTADPIRSEVRVANRRPAVSKASYSGETSSRYTKNPFFSEAPKLIRAEKAPTANNKAPNLLAKQIQTADHTVESAPQSNNTNELPQTSLDGPAHIGFGDISNFVFTIPNYQNSKSVAVELGVTEGLEIVVVDREVTVDQLNRTINWHLNNADQSGPVKIRYRVKASQEGYFLQQAKIKVDGKVVETVELGSVVKLGVDSSDAPLLAFEK